MVITPDAKILIIEDDSAIRTALQAFFSMVSVRVNWAENGQEALDFLSATDRLPNLILVDGRLPDMHGLELIQRLRNTYALPHTSIYLFSADTYSNNLETLGVDGFIPKPFDADNLISLAEKYA